MIIVVNAASPLSKESTDQDASQSSVCGSSVHAVCKASSSWLINFLIALGYDPIFTPLAALLAPAYAFDKPCLIATPVFWKATHNDVMIQASGAELHHAESLMRVWVHELNQFLMPNGFKLVYHDQNHWLVFPPDAHTLKAPAVTWMHHRSMMPILTALDDTLYWQRLMTEIQMFLAQHPLNQQMHQKVSCSEHEPSEKALPFNGLWFWGSGSLDKTHHPEIYTDSSIIHAAFPEAKSLDLIDFKDKKSIIAIERHDPALLTYYEKQLQHQTVKWIWNGLEYRTGSYRYGWRRLWRCFWGLH